MAWASLNSTEIQRIQIHIVCLCYKLRFSIQRILIILELLSSFFFFWNYCKEDSLLVWNQAEHPFLTGMQHVLQLLLKLPNMKEQLPKSPITSWWDFGSYTTDFECNYLMVSWFVWLGVTVHCQSVSQKEGLVKLISVDPRALGFHILILNANVSKQIHICTRK